MSNKIFLQECENYSTVFLLPIIKKKGKHQKKRAIVTAINWSKTSVEEIVILGNFSK